MTVRAAASAVCAHRVVRRTIFGCSALAAMAGALEAQRVPLPPPRDTVKRDTVVARPARRIPNSIPDSLLRPPITPKAAFLRSLLVPGWGQSALRRSTAATIFASAELGMIYMVGKSRADLRSAKALQRADSLTVGDPGRGEPVTRVASVDPRLVNARRLHLEDWLAAWIFNHLLAGADAYVAANLWDLPARVSIQQTPVGPGIGAQFRW